MACEFVGTQQGGVVLCHDIRDLTPEENVALEAQCTHWAEDSQCEWENIDDCDANDVNLAEVWQDGEHFLRTEAMHEELALAEDVPHADPKGGLLGTYVPEPTTKMVQIIAMGDKYIQARTEFGDAYCHPKLTNIVKAHGGVDSTIRAKMVKVSVMDNKAFPWKVIHLESPQNQSVVKGATVKVIRMGKKFILGSFNDESVWIDPKMTKLIRSYNTETFKMKLKRSDHGFPWKATYIFPPVC